jgi:AcrR family transcriptional regulator
VAGKTSEESAETRAELLRAARDLFATRGFSGTSVGAVVAKAGVTRGALYHHFTDKRSLFESVVLDVQDEVVQAIGSVSAKGAPRRLGQAVDRFFEALAEPRVQQILLRDAPAVLGWPRWDHPAAASHVDLITAAIDDGGRSPAESRALAHLLGAALIEAALLVAEAADREQVLAEMRSAIDVLLVGIAPSPTKRRSR